MRIKYEWGWTACLAVLILLFLIWGARADVYGGDSIACGAGHAAGAPTLCKVGAGSCEIAQRVPQGLYGWVVVSAGVNDAGKCVTQVRARIGSVAKVLWIVPPPKYTMARAVILRVGQAHGDRFVTYIPGKDGLHPRSYPELVRAIKATEAWAR
jgi:hypothetical protein